MSRISLVAALATLLVLFSIACIVVSAAETAAEAANRPTTKFTNRLLDLIGDRKLQQQQQQQAVPDSVQARDVRIGEDVVQSAQQQPPVVVDAWVYFSDKGFRNIAEKNILLEAARNELDPKTLWRRSKNQKTVDVADIPIPHEYVQSVIDAGAKLRSKSKWLNAVSVSATEAQLSDIAKLMFVEKIDVVNKFRREEPITATQDDQGTHNGNSNNNNNNNDDVARRLERYTMPGTRSVNEIDRTIETQELDYGPSRNQLEQINVIAAHNAGYKANGTIVLILDTGFNLNHQSLPANQVIAQYDFVNNDTNTGNQDGQDQPAQENHGTSVFSVIAGRYPGQLYGPALDARFLLAKTENVAVELPIEEDYFIAGLEWGESLGADIATASLGYSDWYTWRNFDGKTAPITLAVNHAVDNGLVVIISAGNNNFQGISAPADSPGCISVGAITALGSVSSFSSRGPTFDGRIKPEICAQGTADYCADYTNPVGFKTCSGTSFSAPLVAGVAAILLSAHPEWTPWQLKEALTETATRSGPLTYTCGWGTANAMSALNFQPTLFQEGTCPNNCSNAGTCQSRGRCQCNADRYGFDCSLPKATCESWCQNGSCSNGICVCNDGYSGIYCSCKGTKCTEAATIDQTPASSSASSDSLNDLPSGFASPEDSSSSSSNTEVTPVPGSGGRRDGSTMVALGLVVMTLVVFVVGSAAGLFITYFCWVLKLPQL